MEDPVSLAELRRRPDRTKRSVIRAHDSGAGRRPQRRGVHARHNGRGFPLRAVQHRPAWSQVYPQLRLDQVVTRAAQPIVKRLARICITEKQGLLAVGVLQLALKLSYLKQLPWETGPVDVLNSSVAANRHPRHRGGPNRHLAPERRARCGRLECDNTHSARARRALAR
jgi:hypothetical protein